MKFLGNLLWLLLGGVVAALMWSFIGLLICVTVVGIPFGVQCLKIAGFVLWPFGRDASLGGFGIMGALGNVIWILLCGVALCVTHFAFGLIMCATVIGIPFGLQHFKLAKLSLIPFGAKIIMK